MQRTQMTHDEARAFLRECAAEAENANRHDMCNALHDLARYVRHLKVGETIFGVVDTDEWGDRRFAFVEIV